jgi:hypothetical protein
MFAPVRIPELTRPVGDGGSGLGLIQFYSVKADEPVWTALALVRLPAGPGPSRPPEELGRIDLQDGCQLLDYLQSHVGHGPLDPTEVRPVHPRIMGQSFLRNLPFVPEAAKVRRKKLSEVHVRTQPTCGLLAHGFKAAKLRRGI